MITVEQLVKLGASKDNATKYIEPLNKTMVYYHINTNARISQFLAQLFVESGALSINKENLNYSVESLKKVFPSKFELVKQYGRTDTQKANQEALDKVLYGGYRGRGLIQITGIQNYKSVAKALNIDCITNPSLLEQPEYACLSAGFYWDSIKANNVADIDNEQAVNTITKLVNGPARMGLQERINYWKKAKEIWK